MISYMLYVRVCVLISIISLFLDSLRLLPAFLETQHHGSLSNHIVSDGFPDEPQQLPVVLIDKLLPVRVLAVGLPIGVGVIDSQEDARDDPAIPVGRQCLYKLLVDIIDEDMLDEQLHTPRHLHHIRLRYLRDGKIPCLFIIHIILMLMLMVSVWQLL